MALEFYERDQARAGGLLAGGLAFRLFLWLLPFALVGVTVLGVLISFSDTSAEDVARDAGLSAALASTVAQAVEGSRRGRVFLLLLGLVLLVWAGAGVVRALRVVSGVAWGIERGGGPRALVGSLVLSGVYALLLVAVAVASSFYGGPFTSDLLVSAGLLAVLAAVVAWAMSMLPHPTVPWTAHLPGALVLAAGTEVLRVVTTVYFAGRLGRVADLYGALGLAAVFMAWLYLVGRLFVAGVSLNAAIWERRGGGRSVDGVRPGPPGPGDVGVDPQADAT